LRLVHFPARCQPQQVVKVALEIYFFMNSIEKSY
jgi:hypothetical protein